MYFHVISDDVTLKIDIYKNSFSKYTSVFWNCETQNKGLNIRFLHKYLE